MSRALAPPLARPGFVGGARSFFFGFKWLLATPDAWPLAAVPVLVGAAVASLLGWLGLRFGLALLDGWLGHPSGLLAALGLFVVKALFALLVALLALAGGLFLAQPLSGPALEGLVRKVEASLGAPPRPKTSLLADAARSLASAAFGAVLGLPVLAALFALGLAVPVLVVFTFPAKILVVSMVLAWDLCDYPLSVRGLPFRDRVGFLFSHLGEVLGFGLGLALLSLLPCALLLVLPAGVAGAARLCWEMESWERESQEREKGLERERGAPPRQLRG